MSQLKKGVIECRIVPVERWSGPSAFSLIANAGDNQNKYSTRIMSFMWHNTYTVTWQSPCENQNQIPYTYYEFYATQRIHTDVAINHLVEIQHTYYEYYVTLWIYNDGAITLKKKGSQQMSYT